MNAPIRMSILSQRSAATTQVVKLGGKIRPGIKMLTNKAKANERAKAIYDEGVALRLKYSEIEKKIKEVTNLEYALYPMNTPYFNVAASDFGMPEIADIIVEKYGEKRGQDNRKQLYRFPVVFHSDDLNEIYPNEFKRYGGEPGYESHYGEDGIRYCRYLPAVTKEMLEQQKANRIKRPPRREKVIRGKCEPNVCPEFLAGQCKFRGHLQFYIPGIPTTGLVSIDTTSEYAAEAIWSDLERISKAFGGIPRSNPNKPDAYIFYITKAQEQRTYFDENGQKKTGLQWVPKLIADIDMGALLANTMTPLISNHVAPVAWLAKPKGMQDANLLPAPAISATTQVEAAPTKQEAQSAVAQAQQSEKRSADVTASAEQPATTAQPIDPLDLLSDIVDKIGEAEEENIGRYFDFKFGGGWEDDNERILKGIELLEAMLKKGAECAKQLIRLSLKSFDLKLDQQSFQKYLTVKYGKGYQGKVGVLETIVKELDELVAVGPEAAQSFISAQLLNAEGKPPF